MKRITAIILAVLLTAAVCGAPAEPAGQTETETAPRFLIPSYFVARFNTFMDMMTQQHADFLGEDGVRVIQKYFRIVESDPVGETLFFGNADWNVEAAFTYGDEESASEDAPALALNLTIKSDVPEIAAYFTKYSLRMMIAYDFQEDVSVDELKEWFDSAEDPADIFTIPGYTLNVLKNDEQVQYAILPPREKIPQLQDLFDSKE